MKTKNNNKLVFNKNSVTELNDSQLQNVNGGITTLPCAVVSLVSLVVLGVSLITNTVSHIENP